VLYKTNDFNLVGNHHFFKKEKNVVLNINNLKSVLVDVYRKIDNNLYSKLLDKLVPLYGEMIRTFILTLSK